MELGRFGVDQIGGQLARVVAKQRVRQGAVAPVEARQVQTGEELDERVQEPLPGVQAPGLAEQRPICGRILQVPGDQGGVDLWRPIHDDPLHDDAGYAEVGEPAEQAVLSARQTLRELLYGPHVTAVLHEPDHVAVDAFVSWYDQPAVGPLRKRQIPGQVQKTGGLGGRRDEDYAHRVTPDRPASRRLSKGTE